MSAPAFAGRPALTIRGTRYPVLLPTVRDPRLHLAAVIITLQVLGQTVFGFQLSIAQILVALGTCAVLEVGIAFVRHKILLWPASALLTGNGVAFVLRVPGTPHGDWWSLHGAWIFAGTAAIALLSKHVIRYEGRHLFNPSNFGLVVCFLVLGKDRADPLDFWWGPMSVWLALAVCLIVVGGLTILSRLRLLFIAVAFWLTFAAGIAVLAASGHSMTARWHLGPDLGVGLLVAARELAGDPRLPLLHDHGPPDDPARARRPAGLRGERRAARDAPHRTADDRVRDEGRGARRARARLPRPPAARASPARRRLPWRQGARVGVAHRPATQAARRDVRPRGGARGRAGRARRDPGAARRGHRRVATRQRADARSHRRHRRWRLVERRPEDGAGDRTRRRPRSPGRVGRPSPPGPAASHGRRRGPVAREPPAPDRRRGRRHHRSVLLRGRGRADLARSRQGPGPAEDPGRAERDAAGRRVPGPPSSPRRAASGRSVHPLARGRPVRRPLRHRRLRRRHHERVCNSGARRRREARAGDRGARRRSPPGRRPPGRARLPPGRLPLRGQPGYRAR